MGKKPTTKQTIPKQTNKQINAVGYYKISAKFAPAKKLD